MSIIFCIPRKAFFVCRRASLTIFYSFSPRLLLFRFIPARVYGITIVLKNGKIGNAKILLIIAVPIGIF